MPTPLIVALIISFAIIIWAGRCIMTAGRLHPATRIVAALTFAPIALFCIWGFAAAMEPGDYRIVWRVGYAVVFVASLFAIGWLVLARRIHDKTKQDCT